MLQNESQKLKAVSELETKYQTVEKEKKILEQKNSLIVEQQQKERNRNIAIVLGSSLIVVIIITFLVYHNRKRKQELALKQKELKTEKLTNQLKEQELKAINALIEGQEKERLAIANDLHDDLGSLMATIKLHFGTFKDNETSSTLFTKTNSLLDEAYQKIRNIAHTKNSGVLAKQGLYEAVVKLSNSISQSEKIKINVLENNLNHRLENSLELTIFRIMQELITNVIKHAEATEVDIHLNEHDNILNIMVEDNGIGFNTAQQTKNITGIGLISIERRIEKLGGKLIIESQLGKGTSVIIDIPL
jgi:hypothetical protein